MNNWPTY